MRAIGAMLAAPRMPIRTCADTDSTLALNRELSGPPVLILIEGLQVDVEDRDGIEDDAVVVDVAVPQREKLGQLVRARGGQIVDLAPID